MRFGFAGLETIAYELVAHFCQAQRKVIAPLGHSSMIFGIFEGFQALRAAGIIDASPRLIGMQARASVPVWAQANKSAAIKSITEGQSIAKGLRERQPLRGDELLNEVAVTGRTFVIVMEEEILPGRDALAHLGFYVASPSAIARWALE